MLAPSLKSQCKINMDVHGTHQVHFEIKFKLQGLIIVETPYYWLLLESKLNYI